MVGFSCIAPNKDIGQSQAHLLFVHSRMTTILWATGGRHGLVGWAMIRQDVVFRQPGQPCNYVLKEYHCQFKTFAVDRVSMPSAVASWLHMFASASIPLRQ